MSLTSQVSAPQGTATDAALAAFHSDCLDPFSSERLLDTAAQEPKIRLTFRDPYGELQASTLLSTYTPYIGKTKAEQRKLALYRAFQTSYRMMGCELVSLELVTTYPVAI